MDIRYFYKSKKIKRRDKLVTLAEQMGVNKDQLENKDLVKKLKTKRTLKSRYFKVMGDFLGADIIDMLEYTFLINFYEKGGSIVGMGGFYKIFQRIMEGDKLDDKNKDRFKKLCSRIFEHLIDFNNINENPHIRCNMIVQKMLDSETNFKFTEDQKMGIHNIISFLYNDQMKSYGLYGFAGTGKTTLITKLVNFLLFNNYVKSVCFTAPTNKAVNIMKSKFRSQINRLLDNIGFQSEANDNIDMESLTIDEQFELLEGKGFKVDFITIHKLLNYKNDFSAEGDRIFIKDKKASSIFRYDLVLVDECSMIPMQIIANIFQEIRKNKNRKDSNLKKLEQPPKIMFVGDPAQLPPVNEKVSSIFATTRSDFDIKQLKYFLEIGGDQWQMPRIEALMDDIISQEDFTLKEVVRSSMNSVVNLSNHIRSWVLEIINMPRVGKYKGKGVHLYKYNREGKTKTKWLNTYINRHLKFEEKGSNCIILTWTNRQSDEYNTFVRKIQFKDKKIINQFEVGDKLILNDFYKLPESEVHNTEQKEKDRKKKFAKGGIPKRDGTENIFYTSELIRVADLEEVTKGFPGMSEILISKAKKIKQSMPIEEKYRKSIQLINKSTKRRYKVWKLHVHKIADAMIENTIPEVFQILVIKKEDYKLLEKERNLAAEKIRELKKYYQINYREQYPQIEKLIIRPAWKEFNAIFISPFANVNASHSTTSHKAQGSSYYDVFIDLEDILRNPNVNEMKRCIYTAITRAVNEIHLLI